MHWQDLESHIHDNSARYTQTQMEKLSAEILESLKDNSKPMQAARMAYVLTLIQLKAKKVSTKRSLKFFNHLCQILKHEISVSEANGSAAQTVYARKLSEQYFHHLSLIADDREQDMLAERIHAFRKSNHEKLMRKEFAHHTFREREERFIQSIIKKHYLFVGFLFAIALYFSWTTFWSMMDFAMAQWVFSEFTTEHAVKLIQQAFLLLFSMSFVWAFVKYQKNPSLQEEV
jgi:transcriptional regulator CtsR